MKKLTLLICVIIIPFFFHPVLFAETINGLTEGRDSPNGRIIVKLNDGVQVKCLNCLDAEGEWNHISITIKYKNNNCSSTMTKGEILYYKNNVIGEALDVVALNKMPYDYSYDGHNCISQIDAYVESPKIRDDSIIQTDPVFYDVLVDGRVKEIERFLSNKKNVNAVNGEQETPLMLASRYGYENIVKLLIAKGSNINSKNQYGWTALRYAMYSKQVEIVGILLSHGADINEIDNEGNSPILRSAGNKKIVSLLLDHGANINTQNNDGDTLLIIASRSMHSYSSDKEKYIELVKFLIEQGADIKTSNKKGVTALIAAYGFPEMLNLLVSKGADINAQNRRGQTALMLAANGNYYESAEELLSKGADINKKDIFGRTALWYAKNCPIRCRNVEKVLRDHGAAFESDDPYEQKFHCSRLTPDVTHAFSQGNAKKEIFLISSEPLIPLEGYLREDGYCRPVLFGRGSWGRHLKGDVEFRKSTISEFPDIALKSRDRHKREIYTVYIWDGRKYEMDGLKESIELNKKALELFDRGDIQGAIALWEDAYKLALLPYFGITANSEVINNLGFAYHTLAKQMKSDDYYNKAEQFYKETQQIDEKRWEAYLNLADLYAKTGNYRGAIQNYQQLISIKPDYKFADRVRSKIKMLEIEVKKGSLITTLEQIVVGKNMPLYTFKLFGDAESRSIERIVIYRTDMKKELQTIEVSILNVAEEPNSIEFEDINFDRYKDLKIRIFAGATGNEGYSYYLFNPKTKSFIFNKDFADLDRPDLFTEKKQFTTYHNMGSAGAEFYQDTYEVRNGKPVLIRSVRQEYLLDKGYLLRTEEVLIDGKMEIVREIKNPKWE